MPWYESMEKVKDWDFKKEMVKYCWADVDVLAKAVLKFRKNFKDSLDIDPFRYITLSSLFMSIFKGEFMPAQTITSNNIPKRDNAIAREWLTHIEKDHLPRDRKIHR
jgi:hypothetical protein